MRVYDDATALGGTCAKPCVAFTCANPDPTSGTCFLTKASPFEQRSLVQRRFEIFLTTNRWRQQNKLSACDVA